MSVIMTNQNKIVAIKTPKSKGIAILLVFLFGPIGMFYATIRGALIMLLIAFGACLLIFDFSGFFISVSISLLLIFLWVYLIVCIVWSYNAVVEYNQNIEDEINAINKKQNNVPANATNQQNQSTQKNENKTVLYNQLEHILSLKQNGLINEEQFEKEKQQIHDKIFGIEKKEEAKPKPTPIATPPAEKLINDVSFETKRSLPKQEVKEENPNKTLYIIFGIILTLIVSLMIYYVYFREEYNVSKNNTENKTATSKEEKHLQTIQVPTYVENENNEQISSTEKPNAVYNAEEEVEEYYTVSSDKAYFYNSPSSGTQRKAYLIEGDRVYVSKTQNEFGYAEFENSEGKTTSGWIKLSDIERE
ncbi:MAG: hypothetical protein KF900_04800 [Bacteroidetes bacterium]|nr:hypothetical protein [Bacteroidota bacterium]